MAAQYPTTIRTFDRRQDGRDVVIANDINIVYDEVEAIEAQLGAGGVITSSWSSDGNTFVKTATWASLSARLQNIEDGVIKSQIGSVSASGASVIIPSTASTVGLTIKGAASQTASLFKITDNSSTQLLNVSAEGKLTAVSIDGGTA